MEAKLVDNGVLFVKLNYPKYQPEIYSDTQIKDWLKDDKIDKKTVAKLKKLLKKDVYG